MSMFDDIIKQKANVHEAPVPHDAWNNIINKKQRKPKRFLWWMVCIGLCGSSVIYYHYFSSGNKLKIGSSKDKAAQGTLNTLVKNQSRILPPEISSGKKSNAEKTTKHVQLPADKNNAPDQAVIMGTKAMAENSKAIYKKHKHGLKNSREEHQYFSHVPAVKIKEKLSPNKKTSKIAAVYNDDEEKNNLVFTLKKNIIKQDKGKTLLNILAGETDSTASNEKEKRKKETSDVAENDLIKNEQQKKADDNREKSIPASVIQKEKIVDSIQKNIVIETTKAKKTLNKALTKLGWVIDLAIAPVLVIEQYDKGITFSRSLTTGNRLSVFSGKLNSTGINPSAAFSLSLRKEVNKKFSFGTGIRYLQLRERIKISGTETNTQYTIVDRLVNSATGPELISDTIKATTEGIRNINAWNSYHFISIPVFIQFSFIQKRSWSSGVVAGLNINVYSKYKNEINKNTAQPLVASVQTSNNNNTGLSFFGGLRFGKRIFKRIEIFGAPMITWTTGSQNIRNSLLNKKMKNASLSFGLSYQLKK